MSKQKRQLSSLEIPDRIITKWQGIVNLMAKTLDVPAGLIMRIDPPKIEVFISSQSKNNPYKKGERADLNTGLYCETVMNKKKMLHVPDALKDPTWDHNPDIGLGMTCYLGFPIHWPDGKIFGTICVLDTYDNTRVVTYKELIEEFRNNVESDLQLFDNAIKIKNLNQELKEHHDFLEKQVSERTNDLKIKNKKLHDEISRRKESDAKFSSAFKNSPVALILSNLKTGEIYAVNKAFTSMTGHARENAIGNTTIGLNMWTADIRRDDLRAKMKKGGSIKDFEITFKKKSGEEFIALLTVNHLGFGEKNMILSSIVDITEQKNTEIVLKESEEKFSKAFRSGPDTITISRMKDGKYIDVNEAFCRLSGYKKEEVIGKTSLELGIFKNKKDRQKLTELLGKKGRINNLEMEYRNRKGETVYGLTSIEMIDYKNSPHMLTIVKDTTDKKKMEEKLNTTQSHYYEFINSSSDVVTYWTMPRGLTTDLPKKDQLHMIFDGVCEDANKSAWEYMGFTSRDQVIGRKIKDLFDLHYTKDSFIKFINNNYRLENKIVHVILPNGKDYFGYSNWYGKIKDGELESIWSVSKDITALKAAEDNLIESEKKYRALVDNAPSVMWKGKENGTTVFISDNVKEIYGYTADEVYKDGSKLWFGRIHKNDVKQVDYNFKELFKSGKTFFAEYRIKHKDGKWIWLRDTAELVLEESGEKVVYGAFTEITDQKTAELELQNAYNEIKELRDRISAENVYLRKSIEPSNLHKDIIGNSDQIQEAVEKALQVAETDSTVLLLGETGTGKELLAKGIHNSSNRKDKTLVTINCAAIPEALIESELFGHEKGAFTDSKSKKIGLFEVAHESTIFLDEIGELPYNVQAKLLRVIDNKELYRIGSTKPIEIDVRIIAATNQNLEELTKEKKFREDLFYRINVFNIVLPPLRTRTDDILPLIEKFIKDLNNQMGKSVISVSKSNLEKLKQYPWPGNVRELRNVVERSMIQSEGKWINLHIPRMESQDTTSFTSLEDIERNHILQVLESTYWKVSGKGGAAEILGLNRNTLNSKIKKLGIKKSQ